MDLSQILGESRAGKMLFGAIQNKRVANAYLFVGTDDSQKNHAAISFAMALNCETDSGKVCGKCQSCQKIEKGIHPDVIRVAPAGKSIKIDQIRELISYTRYGPSSSRTKVCIIEDVSLMTAESANSFLKTLEEPKPDTVFILLSFSDSGILRTIISRCQKVLFEEGSTLADAKGRDVLLEAEAIGQEIASARKNGLSALLKVSSRLAVRDGGVEDLLAAFSEALWRAKKNNFPVKAVRVILDALSAIKKRANVRLALDVMCLKLWEI